LRPQRFYLLFRTLLQTTMFVVSRDN